MDISWYGHSTFGLKFGDSRILIDPFLKDNPSFDNAGFDAVIEGTTHIILTHGHGDHIGDTLEIAKTTGAQVIGSYDLIMWLRAQGLENTNGGNTGGTLACPGFSVTFVQAHHSSTHIDENGVSHALGNPCGVVLHIEGEKSVYHMGDTDIFGDMALIQELHQPQIAMVPIGDRFTMGGAVAALACRRFFRFETIFPCHFGTFPIIDQDADKFINAMEGDSGKVKLISVGDSVTL